MIQMMKYVKHEKLGFILFEKNVSHDTISKWFGNEVCSAGLVILDSGHINCFGESTTLMTGSDPTDTFYLRKELEP